MKKIGIVWIFLIGALPAVATDTCSEEGVEREQALRQWDDAMNWVVPFSSRTFLLKEGKRPIKLEGRSKNLDRFLFLHGYFSCHTPLIGKFTEDISSINSFAAVFLDLNQGNNPEWTAFATRELLTKGLAYRHLQKGMKIQIPSLIQGRSHLVSYEVDEVLDLWQGMPAFGLLPEDKEEIPILLFRGTDFSFTSKSSWASILSDFDLAGAGFTTFRSSESKIEKWLEKTRFFTRKAEVMGFSLGGILAVYTAIYQDRYVGRCSAFNAPGVSRAVFSTWKELSSAPAIYLYATQGDLISRFGNMVSTAFEISDKGPMGPIDAHTKVLSGKSPLLLFEINIQKENQSRFKGKEE